MRRRSRHAPAALAAAGALCVLVGAGLRAARGDGAAPPADTAYGAALPPYAPLDEGDREAVRSWCERALAAGRARAGTQPGGDWILSAAWFTHHALAEPAEAAARFEEAARAYPATDPSVVVALTEAARLHLATGDATAARRDVDALDGLRRAGAGRTPPVDAGALDRARHEAAVRALELDLDEVAADVAEREGRAAVAAERLEDLARRLEGTSPAAGGPDRGRLLARAADLRRRGGDRERAHEDATRAIEAASDPLDLVHRSFWRLFLDHDALDPLGGVGLLRAWPGEAFERDLEGTLRGLEGNPHVGTYLLTVGSGALLSGRPDVAMRMYERGLGDRHLMAEVRERPELARALLPAFDAALTLGRFDVAERWVETVAGLGSLPRETTDRLRVLIRERRDAETAAREREAREAREAERATDGGDAPRPRGTLSGHAAEPGGEDPEGGEDGDGAGPPGDGTPWGALLTLAAVALAIVALAWLARRGR